MHFESTKIDNSIITATSKKLGIILLTDNRNTGPFDRDIINDLKGSLCKGMFLYIQKLRLILNITLKDYQSTPTRMTLSHYLLKESLSLRKKLKLYRNWRNLRIS